MTTHSEQITGPLSGYTVLDLTIARAGPSAVRLLSDWGARVIKIEAPSNSSGKSLTGNRLGADEQNLHRNKRGLTLDLKQAAGHDTFLRLVRQADIVVENFRPDVKTRLKVDYETLKEHKPNLIYGSISGFGQSGPWHLRPGVDQIVQGMSGLMSITGTPESGPTRAGIAISDTTAGMFLAQGLLLALLHRERTGEGQWVHTSLLEGMLAKLDFQGARYTMDGDVPQPQGNHHPTQVPMGTFIASDGMVNIAAPTSSMWHKFCDALKADELHEHADYASSALRNKNRHALTDDINKVTRRFSVNQLVELLNEVGVPCGPIYGIDEAFDNPQSTHLSMQRSAPHPERGSTALIRSPINLSAFTNAQPFHHSGPLPGEHSEEVLAEFGFAAEEISRLQAEHIIQASRQ